MNGSKLLGIILSIIFFGLIGVSFGNNLIKPKDSNDSRGQILGGVIGVIIGILLGYFLGEFVIELIAGFFQAFGSN